MTATPYNKPSAFDILLKDFFSSSADFSFLETSKAGHPVDIYHDLDGLHFEIACTGISKDQVTVQVEGDILKIRYNKPTSEEKDQRTYLYKSISKRSFNLGYRLAARYDLSGIKGSFTDGLLTLTVPLAKEAKPKTIEIE